MSLFVCSSLSSAAPVWTPRQVTWSWTVGNKISPPPSSAFPPRLLTHRMKASLHHLPRFQASCATPGRLPIPMKPSKSPLYNLRPCLTPPPNNHLVALSVTLPMNSELLFNLWFWTWCTAGWRFGEHTERSSSSTTGCFEFLSQFWNGDKMLKSEQSKQQWKARTFWRYSKCLLKTSLSRKNHPVMHIRA